MGRSGSGLAAVFAALAACGGGGGSNGSDAGTSDAGNADAATHGPVTVRIYRSAAPVDMATVMYNDADGTFLGTVLTDGAGTVTIDDFPVGGSITAVADPYGRPISGVLTSITNVELGDTLIIGKTPTARSSVSAGPFTVAFTGTVGGASQYAAMGGCDRVFTDTPATPITLTLRQVCVPGSTIDVAGYAQDAFDNRLGYAVVTDVARGSGVATLPPWASDLATYSLTAESPPRILQVDGFYTGYRQGIPIDEVNRLGSQIQGSGSQEFAWKLAGGFFTGAGYGVDVRFGDGTVDGAALSSLGRRLDQVPAAGATDTGTVDLSADLLPEVSDVMPSASDPLGVVYTATGAPVCDGSTSADAAIWALVGNDGATTTTWLVLSPGDLASGTQLPALDPDLADTLWPAGSFTSADAGIIWIADSTVEYADIRRSEANFDIGQFLPAAAGTRCMLRTGRFGASAR